MMIKLISFSLASIFFFSCSGTSELENKYEIAISFKNENKIQDANKIFHQIVESKESSNDLRIRALFAIAQLYYDSKDYLTSIDYFKKLLTEKKENAHRKKSLFMIGYIYNNHLDMYTDAINYYKQFLDEYSADELVPSVEYELDQVDKIISKVKN